MFYPHPFLCTHNPSFEMLIITMARYKDLMPRGKRIQKKRSMSCQDKCIFFCIQWIPMHYQTLIRNNYYLVMNPITKRKYVMLILSGASKFTFNSHPKSSVQRYGRDVVDADRIMFVTDKMIYQRMIGKSCYRLIFLLFSC